MKKKKKCVTLIEIMIVIVIIGIIGGALAFNMRGSLDEGKIFKTKQNISRVEDILTMELASSDKTGEDIVKKWDTIVADSPLANGKETCKDGWKKPLKVKFEGDKFIVTSEKWPKSK